MVVNLCLPHFNTTVNCNKLCADGYDVTNLLSADTAIRRRGFKLEYFLRPPVQVTLKFGFQVEVCRVDVELWPWGMDRGLACKRLEISTSSDSLPHQTPRQAQQKNQKKGQPCDEHDNQEQDNGRHLFNGHQSCLPAHQQSADHESQHTGRANRRAQQRPLQSNSEGQPAEPAFKLVGRCELTEDTRVCFSNVHFRPRHPLTSAAPPPPADSRQEELWSRGPLSLGSVGQLRVTLPFGGAASALGLKALAVWGQPARCCPAQEVEGVRRAHEASQRRLQQPPPPPPPQCLASFANQPTPSAGTTHSSPSVPEEFLDPITQEVMRLPMLLPGGVSVDSSTLEECQKRDATWGRPPSDPFTGVPFTAASQPLPNPQLKIRIDHFILRTGVGFGEGTSGRRSEAEKPQPSSLLAPTVEGEDQRFYGVPHQATPDDCIRSRKRIMLFAENGSKENGNSASCPQSKRSKHWCNTISTSDLSRPNKDVGNTPVAAREPASSVRPWNMEKQPLHELESQRTHTFSTWTSAHVNTAPSSSSHEQRLSASLDEALLCALQGRPSFTSNALHKELPNTSQHMLDSTSEKCSACSCFLSLYTTSTSPAYRLPCAHLLCRACLHSLSRPLNSVAIVTASHILCPTCQNPASCSDIIRVHH